MDSSISFVLDGRLVSLDFQDPSGPKPTTTVLNYLRSLPTHRGVKEGCAEGDCGACTVALGEPGPRDSIRYRSIDSCLVFLPMIHGKHLVTVENLCGERGELHPVQQEMVNTGGSQCGYCTPGIIMSLFALYKSKVHPSRGEIDDALTGNLCRCTGYKPIIEAAGRSCVHRGTDSLSSGELEIRGLLKSVPKDSIQISTPTQQYFRPSSLPEALKLKRVHRDARVLCGATDVALRVTKKHDLLETVVDLSGIEVLREIVDDPSCLSIGAGVPLNDAMPKLGEYFPALHEILSVFGSQQIRNLATFGGNLATASPIGDTIPVLMAYHATVVLENGRDKREVPMADFIIGYRKTARKANELITRIDIPKSQKGALVRSYKISKRKDLDISTVSGGFRLELDKNKVVNSILLAYGGMAERTKRATVAEQFLTGKMWAREVVEEAMPLVDHDFSPISDARGGAEFRRIAARNLLLKFWSETRSSESPALPNAIEPLLGRSGG